VKWHCQKNQKMHTPPLHACILIHFVNEFVYDGAYGFSSRFCMAPDLFVVGFAEVDGNAGRSDIADKSDLLSACAVDLRLHHTTRGNR